MGTCSLATSPSIAHILKYSVIYKAYCVYCIGNAVAYTNIQPNQTPIHADIYASLSAALIINVDYGSGEKCVV